MVPGEDDRPIMTVHAEGTISITDVPGTGWVEPSGQLRFSMTGDDGVLTGTLSPSGTGSGIAQEGDKKATWTATRVRGPDLAVFEEQRKIRETVLQTNTYEWRLGGSLPGIPGQSAPTLRVLDREPHPTGVAVLLEITAPPED